MTKENEIKPLPCPFCGKDPKIGRYSPSERFESEMWFIVCCLAGTGTKHSEREAVEIWNRRTNPELSSLREENLWLRETWNRYLDSCSKALDIARSALNRKRDL